ncbi:MAG: sugar phosphate isomerase/epimerase [Oligosphaeraceae bacterium]|nr:sugar phosphate isomerase/epimerase [Oligosphaeraceae bacterium]
MQHGLQLYNFREELKQDFKGTLKEIAKLGFDGVEFANNYGGIEPEELAAFLRELKLECAGTMFPKEMLCEMDSPAWEMAKALNAPAATFSYTTNLPDSWRTLLEMCQMAGKNAAAHGTVFSYHNHWQEFSRLEDGEYVMTRVLAQTDPVQVFIEPDVCWLTRSGVDPVAYIHRYASRIKQIHLKDLRIPEERETMTALGKGCVDLAGCIAVAKETPCQWLIYEQDHSEDHFADAAESLAFLKKF